MRQPITSTLPDPVLGTRTFLSSAGRIGRLPFAIAMAALLAVFALYEQLVRGPLHAWTAWAVHLPLLFCAACLLSKRLHSFGLAGWWAAPILWGFAAAWGSPNAGLAYVVVAGLLLVAPRGDAGANRFGPPPPG